MQLHYTPNKSIRGIVDTCKCKTYSETYLTETTLTEVTAKYQIENKQVVFVKCFSQCTLYFKTALQKKNKKWLSTPSDKKATVPRKTYKSHNTVILNKWFRAVYRKTCPWLYCGANLHRHWGKEKTPHHSPSVKDTCTCWSVANLLLNTGVQFSKKIKTQLAVWGETTPRRLLESIDSLHMHWFITQGQIH